MHDQADNTIRSFTSEGAEGTLDSSDILSKYAGVHPTRSTQPHASPVSTMDPSGLHEGFAERLSGRSSSFSVEDSSPRDAAGEAGRPNTARDLTHASTPRDWGGSSSNTKRTAETEPPSCSVDPSHGSSAGPFASRSGGPQSTPASDGSAQAWPRESRAAHADSFLVEAISTANANVGSLGSDHESMPGTAASLQAAAAAAAVRQAWSRRSTGTEIESMLYDAISSAQVCCLLPGRRVLGLVMQFTGTVVRSNDGSTGAASVMPSPCKCAHDGARSSAVQEQDDASTSLQPSGCGLLPSGEPLSDGAPLQG